MSTDNLLVIHAQSLVFTVLTTQSNKDHLEGTSSSIHQLIASMCVSVTVE